MKVVGSHGSYLCTIYNNHLKKNIAKIGGGVVFCPFFAERSGSLPADPIEGYNDWTTFFELADPSSLVWRSDQPPP